MNKVIASVLMIVLMSPVVAWSDSLVGPPRPAIVILGDSMSDGAALGDRKGNNNWLHSEGRSEQTGLGAPVTNWPGDNPSTWVNYMAKTFFPGQDALGFLFQCSSVIKSCNPLILNAAFASAETGNNYVNDKSDKTYAPVENRCKSYGDYGQYSCVPGAEQQLEIIAGKGVDLKKAGVILWAGANDIFNDVAKLQSIFGKNLDRGSAVAHKLSQLKASNGGLTEASFDQFFKGLAGSEFDKLHFSNPIKNTWEIVHALVKYQHVPAKNIVVIGLPDLGRLPASSGSYVLSNLLSFLSLGYNEALKNLMLGNYIRQGLTYVDVMSWQREQIESSSWVQDASKRTCVSDKQQEMCMASRNDSSAEKPYLFFNSKHPTVAGHKKLWDGILRQIKANKNGSIFYALANQAAASQK